MTERITEMFPTLTRTETTGVKLATKPRFVEILSDKAVVPLLTEWLDTTFKKVIAPARRHAATTTG